MISSASIKLQVILSALVCIISGTGVAAQTRSADYSLDYAVASNSGASSTIGPYEVVSRVSTIGFSVVPSSSSSYSITTLGASSEEVATVADWVLY